MTALYDMGHGPPPDGPSRVGRYQIREPLGAGAMGVVYRAHDPDLGRDVAIKLVRGNPASASKHVRLLREAQAMARLHHPNVVPIFDVGQTDDAVFVAMPLIEGGTLKRWLRGARSFDEILDRFLAAGRGLAAAHAAGLVHRDFKPDNVLLGSSGEIHVADFGLARLADDEPAPDPSEDRLAPGTITQTGAILGTPAYMAPEQLRGRTIDARVDQFSFCVALWEGIYGQRPFPDPPTDSEHPWRARLDAVAAGPAPPRRDRPAWIAPLLVRGLDNDPDRRWPTLQALLDEIAAHRRPRRWPRRLAIGLGAVGVAAVIALARPEPAQVAVPVAPAPAPASSVLAVTPLAHLDNLKAAAISPDGTRFAFVTGDSLVIEERSGTPDRVVVEHGVNAPMAWSPDNRHVLVGTVPTLAPVPESALVDVDTGAVRELPAPGMASFLSSQRAVLTTPRARSVEIVDLGEPASGPARCDVPGDYTFLWQTAGLPDGTIVVETETVNTGAHGLVILDPSCRATAFTDEPIASFALTDTGTIVALVKHRRFDEIIEISPGGAVVSRRRTAGSLGDVLGRRRGIDYVTTLVPRTELVQVHDGAPQQLLSINSDASIYPAPGGEALVWIVRDARPQRSGELWLSTLSNLSRSRVVLGNALAAGWSPNGRLLAVLVDDSAGSEPPPAAARSLAVLSETGAELQRIPARDADTAAAPVWLDDRRIAIRTDDRARYRWHDLYAPEQGEIGDLRSGSTLWLTSSPRDHTLAMWRMGPPGAIDARTEHLWVQPPDGKPRALPVGDAVQHFLVPSWSSSGELLVRALETGVVSRVALDTGELTAIARLPATPLRQLFDDHLMTRTGGDLLAVNHELGADVAMVRPDDAAAPAP